MSVVGSGLTRVERGSDKINGLSRQRSVDRKCPVICKMFNKNLGLIKIHKNQNRLFL